LISDRNMTGAKKPQEWGAEAIAQTGYARNVDASMMKFAKILPCVSGILSGGKAIVWLP
jgi:hypothetical protein